MKLNAYVLAADPAWIEESIAGYYPHVDRIIVSFDETGTSWTGHPLDPTEAVSRLKALDHQGKIVLAPGRFFSLGRNALASDTAQRQNALDLASEGAAWVLQLDSDEIAADPATLLSCLEQADREGFDALDYPARYVYQHIRDRWYLERGRRLWRAAAAYPGAVAVRAGDPVAPVPPNRRGPVPRGLLAPEHRSLASAERDRASGRPPRAGHHASELGALRIGHAGQDKHLGTCRANGIGAPTSFNGLGGGRRPLRTVAAGQLSRNPDNWLRFLRLADTPDAAARARNGLTS
jgi:hypothetical protein